MQSDAELRDAREELRRLGLDYTQTRRMWPWRLLYLIRFRAAMPRADVTKSWDVWRAFSAILETMPDRDAAILDLGSYNSEILWVLHAAGYSDLTGCDFNPLGRLMPHWPSIRYLARDLTKTELLAASFDAITCVSVIEHGVKHEDFVTEVNRLLRPGGILIFTTDFDGTGAEHPSRPEPGAFGLPWRIFTRTSLMALCDGFLHLGFSWLKPEERSMEHRERPIHWNDEDYTFVCVGLRKSA